ncbi:MAG: hypothetical protein NTV56_19970 [Alphaproteobacteria bacterium]|nr:hypothetical protein [Alphaproteobacteria bacterium]
MNILEAIDDANLFAPWFRDRETWVAWTAFLATLFGLPMTPEQRAIYSECTGRQDPPAAPFNEAWLVCGRRAGKSFTLALTAVYLAVFRDYRHCLAPGERGTVLIVAADRKQARVILRYVSALLKGVPILAPLIERETAEAFDLTNRVTVEVGTASYRTTRGYTFVGVLADELAFWRSEDSASPDYEVLAAVRPGMSTIPGAMLLCASSPYARRGALWDAYQRYYAKDAPVLVWKAPTRLMNPTVPQSVIDEAVERDPASAGAEYMAEFRSDIESFISIEAVRACIVAGVRERAPERQYRYVAFVDPSGGSSDSYTMAIAHKAGDTAILDLLREVKPPFSPEAVTEEFADTLKNYRITKVSGDRYGGEWPREQFRKHGVNYECSDQSKSELYVDLLPLINSRAADLLDHDRLVTQLVGLERRTARGGRDSIDHGPGAHDDIANAVAGALCRAATLPRGDAFQNRSRPRQTTANLGPYADLKRRYSGYSVGRSM